jgi:RHS repeat-associated protein
VITDANGAVTSRKDFAPFGEATVSTQRTAHPEYGDHNVREDFTGYEHDEESGLEFAQARYYSAGLGRYSSVDPLPASATIRNPQTFNRYSYVTNSPYKFVDPLGLRQTQLPTAAQELAVSNVETGTLFTGIWGEINVGDESIPDAARHADADTNRPDTTTHELPLLSGELARRQSNVESDSADPIIAKQNAQFATLFTNGTGIVRTNRGANELYFNGGPSHFRFPSGQVWALHVYGDESGYVSGNVYVPPGFDLNYVGGKFGTVTAHNRQTDELMYYFHIKGVKSQSDLNRNLRTQNAAGWRLVGQTGGIQGVSPGYLHTCIKIYSGSQGYRNFVATGSGRRPITAADYGDFRRFLK